MDEELITIEDLSPAELQWVDGVANRILERTATAAVTPDGSNFADPGYQADKKKRYPLNNDKKVHAAWSYINMPRNASKYSPEDLNKVKSKIKAAAKKIGMEIDDSKSSASCWHTALASSMHPMAEGETSQIDAAKAIRQQLLKLLASEADEMVDDEDEDCMDLGTLMNAISFVEQFVASEDYELWIDQLNDEDGSIVKAAQSDSHASAFTCPACGSAVRIMRKTKSKLVNAEQTGVETAMANMTDAELNTLADLVVAKMAAQADKRTVTDVRAGPEETSDPKMSNTEIQTISSEADPAIAAKAPPFTKKDAPADPGEPDADDEDAPPAKKAPPKAAAKASEDTAVADSTPPAPTGGGGTKRSVDDVRAASSDETAAAYKLPDEHKDEKAQTDAKNPARASADDVAAATIAEEAAVAAAVLAEQAKGAPASQDSAADAAITAMASSGGMSVIGGKTGRQRTYNLNKPEDLASYLAMVEANQKQNSVLVGMGNMNTIPTEHQTALAAERSEARRATGGQSSVLGEQPAQGDAYDLTRLFR